jgi:hypothetical protein
MHFSQTSTLPIAPTPNGKPGGQRSAPWRGITTSPPRPTLYPPGSSPDDDGSLSILVLPPQGSHRTALTARYRLRAG